MRFLLALRRTDGLLGEDCMTFYPDLGLQLVPLFPSGEIITLDHYIIDHIHVMEVGSYTATANTTWRGEIYALSIDFDDDTLLKMFSLDILEFHRKIKTTWVTGIVLDVPIHISVTGYFGEVVKSSRDRFIPLKVTDVTLL